VSRIEKGKLRKSLFYFSAFSGITGFYFAGSLVSSFSWYLRAASAIAAVVMGYIAFLEYQDIVELFEEQIDSGSSSSEGREVIPVEVKP
jgi:hypothetical protein